MANTFKLVTKAYLSLLEKYKISQADRQYLDLRNESKDYLENQNQNFQNKNIPNESDFDIDLFNKIYEENKERLLKNIVTSSFGDYEEKFRNKEIPLPDFWGGFLVEPKSIEFWIGRKSRMHDRILYTRNQKNWNIQKLYTICM